MSYKLRIQRRDVRAERDGQPVEIELPDDAVLHSVEPINNNRVEVIFVRYDLSFADGLDFIPEGDALEIGATTENPLAEDAEEKSPDPAASTVTAG